MDRQDTNTAEAPAAEASLETLGPCCWLELCCPPAKAAAALAAKYGMPLDCAAALLADVRLVPRTLPAAPNASRTAAGHEMLARLNRHVQSEVAMVLTALGYKKETA